MSEKVNKFLTTVGSVWGKRHESEAAAKDWFKAWIFALDRYEPWILEAAARRIVDERKDDYFPKPREVHDVCRAIIAEDRRGKPDLLKAAQPANPYKLADELIRGELGKRAAREGWAITLHDFCRDNGRLPNEYETSRLVAVRDKFLDNLRACMSGNGGLFGGDLVKLGRSMVEREHRYAAMILGAQAPLWYAGKVEGL